MEPHSNWQKVWLSRLFWFWPDSVHSLRAPKRRQNPIFRVSGQFKPGKHKSSAKSKIKVKAAHFHPMCQPARQHTQESSAGCFQVSILQAGPPASSFDFVPACSQQQQLFAQSGLTDCRSTIKVPATGEVPASAIALSGCQAG